VAVWIASNVRARPHRRAIRSVITPNRATDRDATLGIVRVQSARIKDRCFPASRLYSATSSMAVRVLHVIVILVDAGRHGGSGGVGAPRPAIPGSLPADTFPTRHSRNLESLVSIEACRKSVPLSAWCEATV
jgi:hypothetical protein